MTGPSNVERAAFAAVALTLVFAVVISVMNWSDRWLHNDVWGYLQRDWSLNGLLRPHSGHPVPLNIAVAISMRDIFGYDTMLQYAILRGLAWSAFLATFAWSVLKRGGSIYAALLSAGVMSAWPLAAFQEGWWISNPLAYAMALYLAVVIAKTDRPSRTQILLVALGTTLLSVLTTTGTVFAFALAIAIVITGKWREWWVAALSAPLIYGAWRAVYGIPQQDSNLRELTDIFSIWFDLARAGLADTFTTSELVAVLILLVSAAVVTYSFIRKGPDLTDVTVLLATGAFLVSVTVYRISQGLANPLAARYQYAVIILLLAIIVPRLPHPSRRWTHWTGLTAVLLLLLLIVPDHVVATARSSDFWAKRTFSERQLLATEASLIASGEPAKRNTPTGVQPLWTNGLRLLLDNGLEEDLGAPRQERSSEARAWLQLGLRRVGSKANRQDCLNRSVHPLRTSQDSITITGTTGTVELLTAGGPAELSLPRQGTYVVDPLFDDPVEWIEVSDSLCVFSNEP